MKALFHLPKTGEMVATGLMTPPPELQGKSLFALYEDIPNALLTRDQRMQIAQSGKMRGKSKFGRSWIGNQRSKGSCNGWAGARALSRAIFRRGLTDIMNRLLSGAYLYSLINGGRDNGSMLDDGMNALQSRGCASEATVPWDRIYPNQYDRQKADAEASENKAFECYAVRTEDGLFSAACYGFDVVVAVHADNGFMSLDADMVAGGGNGSGNHAVAGDGIYWSARRNCEVLDGYNSWGIDYGDEGYMGLTWQQHFRHTTPYHVFYAIRSSVGGDKDGPPVATD